MELESLKKDKRKTALFFAVRNNDEDCVELLLQLGIHRPEDRRTRTAELFWKCDY